MDKHIERARFLTKILDKNFKILGYKIGFDPLIGLVPVLGDLLPAIFGLYFMWIGWKGNIPKIEIARIFINSSLDILLGLVPVLGDFSDIVFRSNTKNLKILEKHLKVGKDFIEGEKV